MKDIEINDSNDAFDYFLKTFDINSIPYEERLNAYVDYSDIKKKEIK